VSNCYGCDDARAGDSVIRAHTCAGSGTFLAAEAHFAGEVDEIMEQWPRFGVAVNFQVRALDEAMVRDKLTALVTSILSDDQVEHSDFTIQELVA
jgi:hypothetical protein